MIYAPRELLGLAGCGRGGYPPINLVVVVGVTLRLGSGGGGYPPINLVVAARVTLRLGSLHQVGGGGYPPINLVRNLENGFWVSRGLPSD